MQLGKTGGTEGAVPPLVDSGQSPEKFAFFTSILAWPETSLTVCLLPSIFYILSSVYFKDGRIVTVLLDSAK